MFISHCRNVAESFTFRVTGYVTFLQLVQGESNGDLDVMDALVVLGPAGSRWITIFTVVTVPIIFLTSFNGVQGAKPPGKIIFDREDSYDETRNTRWCATKRAGAPSP